ncbi:MAG: FCD domain-containing protein [Thermodesulfobacteriota bacterium]
MQAKGDRPNFHQAEPIRHRPDLDRVRTLLADRPRDLLLFELAVQTGLPGKWLLRLKAADLIGLGSKDRKVVEDDHGRPVGLLVMTESLLRAWRLYVDRVSPAAGDYVFKAHNGSEPLKLSSVSNLANEWFAALGLSGPRGLRSLQATYKLHFAAPASAVPAVAETPAHLKGLRPVKMVPAHEIVYRGLLEAIVSGTIPPGERLVPERIALQMNVSRMPVREALQRLRAAGFVSIKSRSGIVVNELSPGDLEEIQRIRLILELEAAGRAALRRDEAVIKRLESIHAVYERSIKAVKIEQAIRYNKEFHMTIYEQAGMPTLSQIIEGLLDRVSPYLHIELKGVDPADLHIQNTVGNHRRMLDGLKERDPDKVKEWLARDHQDTTKRIVDFLSRTGR